MRPGLLVIQHEDECPPGWLGEWLAEAGVRLEVVPGHRGASIPEDTSGYDGLLVLGGEMGAYDDVPCPWLAPTRRLIARAVGEGVPFLGVCLGHQLATVALGGRVARNPVGTATGLTPVVLTDAGRADPLLGTVRSGARAVQWNRDVATTLPAGSTLLARAPDASVQAVRFAALAWGVQFHPEVSPEIFASWTVNGPKALVTRPDGVNVFVAAEDIAAARDELRADWRPLAARFAGIVRSSRAPGSAPPASTSAVSR